MAAQRGPGRRLALVVAANVTWSCALLLPTEAAAQARPPEPVARRHVRPDPNWLPPRSLPHRRHGPSTALGFQFDLFPTLASAAAGKVGYAPQIWAGVSSLRLRLVGAHLQLPDALTFNEDVVDPKLTAVAFIIDRTFGDHFDEFWIGGGVETWIQSASARDGSGKANWVSGVFTVGGGYTWRFAGNFFLDPWLGLHWVLNPAEHQVGDVDYEPAALVANASVKVGWFTVLGR